MWQWLFLAPWLLFFAWWLWRAFGTARTVDKEARGSRLVFVVCMMGGVALLTARLDGSPLGQELWPRPLPVLLAALAIEWLGVAFAIWAREALGKLWSGSVTLKEGHRVVRSGPYRLVRHPIYTGMLTGLSGLGLARGNVAALVALALVVGALRYKIAVEERLLEAHFGEEYRDYRQHVRALIPFVL
jgi:protein-S-isoprenylcysteine O-methyltransferase Ste14